jgi:hypothetical protein
MGETSVQHFSSYGVTEKKIFTTLVQTLFLRLRCAQEHILKTVKSLNCWVEDARNI